jgi:hypothetical protein
MKRKFKYLLTENDATEAIAYHQEAMSKLDEEIDKLRLDIKTKEKQLVRHMEAIRHLKGK